MYSQRQIRILKYLSRERNLHKVLKKYKLKDYDDLYDIFSPDYGLIDFSDNHMNEFTTVFATHKGVAIAERNSWILFSFWLPFGISVIALIKSFLPELVLIWKLIMQSLK